MQLILNKILGVILLSSTLLTLVVVVSKTGFSLFQIPTLLSLIPLVFSSLYLFGLRNSWVKAIAFLGGIFLVLQWPLLRWGGLEGLLLIGLFFLGLYIMGHELGWLDFSDKENETI